MSQKYYRRYNLDRYKNTTEDIIWIAAKTLQKDIIWIVTNSIIWIASKTLQKDIIWIITNSMIGIVTKTSQQHIAVHECLCLEQKHTAVSPHCVSVYV